MAEQTAQCLGKCPCGCVLRTLDLLRERAEDASLCVRDGAAGLTLADAGAALELVTLTLEAAHQVFGSLNRRVMQIREDEVIRQRAGSGPDVWDASRLQVVDGATVHLALAYDGLEVASHLLGVGRGDLLRVERGEI